MVYRRLGFDVIGMTSLAEAKLCREAGLCYQAMAMVTDYDCWHQSEESVTIEMVIGHMKANTRVAREILCDVICALPEGRACGCARALENAILTSRDAIPARVRKTLAPILGSLA
jgi:5'-methylthioadenosine phosphorylase